MHNVPTHPIERRAKKHQQFWDGDKYVSLFLYTLCTVRKCKDASKRRVSRENRWERGGAEGEKIASHTYVNSSFMLFNSLSSFDVLHRKCVPHVKVCGPLNLISVWETEADSHLQLLSLAPLRPLSDSSNMSLHTILLCSFCSPTSAFLKVDTVRAKLIIIDDDTPMMMNGWKHDGWASSVVECTQVCFDCGTCCSCDTQKLIGYLTTRSSDCWTTGRDERVWEGERAQRNERKGQRYGRCEDDAESGVWRQTVGWLSSSSYQS